MNWHSDVYYLVAGLEDFFPFSWEWNNHPNRLSLRGRYTTNQLSLSLVFLYCSKHGPGMGTTEPLKSGTDILHTART